MNFLPVNLMGILNRTTLSAALGGGKRALLAILATQSPQRCEGPLVRVNIGEMFRDLTKGLARAIAGMGAGPLLARLA